MSFVTKTIIVFSELIKFQPNLFSLDSLKSFRADYAALPKLEDAEESQEAIAEFISEWLVKEPAIRQVFLQSLAATPQERSAKGLRAFDEPSPENDPNYREYLRKLIDNTISELEQNPVENSQETQS